MAQKPGWLPCTFLVTAQTKERTTNFQNNMNRERLPNSSKVNETVLPQKNVKMRRIWRVCRDGGGVLRSEVCKDGVLTGVKQIPETSSTSTISKNDAMKHLYKRDILSQLQYYIFFMYQSKPCPAVFSWFAFGRFWSVADPEGYAAGRCRKCWVCSNTTDIMLVRSRWCPAE